MAMVIHNDNGGVVEQYIAREHQVHGQRIVIDGRCMSACTIYLANPNACATPRASFWFHSAFVGADLGGGRVAYVAEDRPTTWRMMESYPPLLKSWIQAHRPYGLTQQMLVLRGRAMFQIIPRC